MILALAANTLRECLRRPFPYVAAAAVVLLAIVSRFFLAFSFGAAEVETVNLGMSAVFLTGFLHASFQGTALVRADLDRGTLGLLLARPVSLESYVAGRFLGVAAAAVVICACVAAAVAALFAVLPAPPPLGALLVASCRALLPVLVLEAAALAASAAAPRTAAPVILIALFVAGSLAHPAGLGLLLPDFSLFGLEARATPSWTLLGAYTVVYASIFLTATYLLLGCRSPLRSQT